MNKDVSIPAADNTDFIHLATVAVDIALCGLMNEINGRVSSELADFLRPSVCDMYSVNVATGDKELSSSKEINSSFRVDFPGLDVFKRSDTDTLKELPDFFKNLISNAHKVCSLTADYNARSIVVLRINDLRLS